MENYFNKSAWRVCCFLVATSLLAGLPTTVAIGVPNLSFGRLVESAQLIVVAQVSESRVAGPAASMIIGGRSHPSHTITADFVTIRTIKGNARGKLLIRCPVPDDYVGYARPQPGTRLLFLTKRADEYEPANPYYFDFPALSEVPLTIEGSGHESEMSAAIEELVAVIASPSAGIAEKTQVLRIDDALPREQYVIEAFRRGLNTVNESWLRRRLQGSLLKLGDITELPDIVKSLMTDTALDERATFLYDISNRVTDRNAVASLQTLLGSHDSTLRAAAMEALWHISDPATTRLFISGLDDSDRSVRYYAVRGLAETTGESPWAPSISEFEQREQKYLTHWREWASTSPRPR